MLRCIEQKVCNKSYMHSNQRIKLNDWYMKIDLPMWLEADFECEKVFVNDNDNDNDHVTDKLFVNQPVAMGYNIVINPDYANLNFEKDD